MENQDEASKLTVDDENDNCILSENMNTEEKINSEDKLNKNKKSIINLLKELKKILIILLNKT